MPSPWKHPKTGGYYLRVRVPSDLVESVGQTWVKRTLGTKDPAEAKLRFPPALMEMQRQWEALRNGPQPLNRQQVMALAGETYRELVGLGGQVAEGDAEVWQAMRTLYEHLHTAPQEARERFLGEHVDGLLRTHGLLPDEASRRAVMAEVVKASMLAAERGGAIAEGDFSPDEVVRRFPEMPASEPPKAPAGPSIAEVFEAWERDHKAAGGSEKTARDWRRMVENFATYQRGQGRSEAAGEATPQHVTAYANHLRHERKLAAKTINDKHLTALRTIYRHGKRVFMVEVNPAEDVAVRPDKLRVTRPKGFTDEEARAILRAARGVDKAPLRWVPWLGAFTGARVGELLQLRREDFREVDGIPFVRVTPEAGSVKTGRYRDVPLHPQLVEEGLLDFARSSKPGALFKRGDLSSVNRFVRDALGLKPGEAGPQPNHAWRHRFKTLGRGAGIDVKLIDAIQGHADSTASGGYGEWPLAALYRAMKGIPRVNL
ncbi:DUF6538 domain-containing protein [Amaricoccus solimangrovi]|nr:DUF6538 domain-containing protein [Amaricoccus solimangrovi]